MVRRALRDALRGHVRLVRTLGLTTVLSSFPVVAAPPEPAPFTPPAVTASFDGRPAISPLEPIELALDRPLPKEEGRLAVFIGLTDATVLFTSAPGGLRTASRSLPFPGGEQPMTIYLVSPREEWTEIARFPLRVTSAPTPRGGATSEPAGALRDGLEPKGAGYAMQGPSPSGTGFPAGNTMGSPSGAVAVVPSLTVALQAQAVETQDPASTREDQPILTASTLQASLQTDMARGAFALRTRYDLVGTASHEQALRFGTMGEGAPLFDLSGYLMQVDIGKAKIGLGNVVFGANRFLMDGFLSRGISVAVPVGTHLDFSVSALNGTSIVGWSNITGLSHSEHRILSGTVGFEFLPSRPGGLRLEASLLQGARLPVSNFNQGNITDREESEGFGFRLRASDGSGRFRMDAGFARSRFTNPFDPSLDPGVPLAPLKTGARDARFLEVGYDILRSLPLTESTQLTLTSTFRHERVDPQFRSVAALVQPNRDQNQIELTASTGTLNLTVGHTRLNDNLEDIPSLLKTYTRRTALLLSASLGPLLGDRDAPSPWLPNLSYSFDQIHQFADSVPINAGFTASQVPDLSSIHQCFTADWLARRWRFGYRFDDSDQDDESRGDAAATRSRLGGAVHAFSLGFAPAPSFDVGLDLSHEDLTRRSTQVHGHEMRDDETLRSGISAHWLTRTGLGLAASLFNTSGQASGSPDPRSENRYTGFDVQLSQHFSWQKSGFGRIQGQFTTRYAQQQSRILDRGAGLDAVTRTQTLTVGLGITYD